MQRPSKKEKTRFNKNLHKTMLVKCLWLGCVLFLMGGLVLQFAWCRFIGEPGLPYEKRATNKNKGVKTYLCAESASEKFCL